MTIVNLSGDQLLVFLSSLAVSYLLALPVGWERKAKSHAHVGLRVFPLIAVAACTYSFLGQQLFSGQDAKEQSDVLQGLMTGIGFVGAGAIVKDRGGAYGLATAAGIWTTGAIGASVSYGFYVIAIMLCVGSLLILRVQPWLRRKVRAQHGEADAT
jgi:putative Mg2+ transporter-C (MgtC) family protein